MIDFIFNLLRALPLVSLLLVIAAIRSKRQRRVQQLIFPPIALVYLLIALFILYRFNDAITSIPRDLLAGTTLADLVPNLTWLYLLENLVVLAVFAVLKLALMPLSRWILSRWKEPIARLVDGIYEFSPEDGAWFISRRLGNMRRYLQSLYWTSIVITVLFFAFVFTFPEWPGFVGPAFPVLAALVIGELFFALDGMTRTEFRRNIEGESDKAVRISNYGPLRKVLRETFPGRVLSDDVHLSSRASLDSGYRLGQLSRSSDERDRLAGAYFSRVRASNKDVDTNLVEASLDLMNGRSVLINNPFYLDLTEYISLPAYYTLLRSRRVLIVAGRDSLVEDLVDWIRRGLEDVTGIPDLWNIEMLGDHGRTNLHVGVLPFADVHNLELMKNNTQFLEGVELVVLAEPSRMMATGQLGLSLVLSRCGKEARPVFMGFDGNHDGLVDALSHLVKVDFTEVVASGLPQGSSNEVVWNSEGPNMHVEILPRVSRYLGMGTEIGAVALKYQVPRFHWVGGDSFPVVDMQWIAEQYYAQINRFADIDLSQDALDAAFIPIANPWAVAHEDNYFLIVEDETANIFETIRKYATRARLSGFINVISEEHLLRDYMVENRELFSADPKAIPSIVADFARTERNFALRMLMTMTWMVLSESELMREFELIGHSVSVPTEHAGGSFTLDREPAVIKRLRELIAEHTSVQDFEIRQLTGFELGDKRDPDESYYRIDEGSGLGAFITTLRPAYFYVEDERGGVNRIGSLLFDHVYQALLPGQFVTYGGKYYEVQSIGADDSRSGVVLRRAADHIRDRRAYRQWRKFDVQDVTDLDLVGSTTDRNGVKIRRARATISAECFGYFELTSRANLESARPVRLDRIPVRSYSSKTLLEIRMRDVPASVRKSITLLLNEIFPTIFPYAHPYVVALTADHEGEFGHLLTELTGAIDEECIYIVEDSMVDLGLIVAVERNWDRLMEIITDYLMWATTPVMEVVEEEKPAETFVLTLPELPKQAKKGNWFTRFMRRISRRVRRDKTEQPQRPEPSTPIASVEVVDEPSQPEKPDIDPSATSVAGQPEPSPAESEDAAAHGATSDEPPAPQEHMTGEESLGEQPVETVDGDSTDSPQTPNTDVQEGNRDEK